MDLCFSVVIPTYNRAELVVRAIRSVLAQTLPPFEVIVVDDGSSDDTFERLQAMGPPVRCIRQPNAGVSSARNLGMELAAGDVICLLDSDDLMAPGWLAAAAAALAANPECGAVCANTLTVSTEGEVRSRNDYAHLCAADGSLQLTRLFSGRFGLGSNLCIRTPVARRVGPFDVSLVTAEDIDYSLRVAAVTRIAHVGEPLIHITQAAGSLSGRINTGNRFRVFDRFEREHPSLAALHEDALRQARGRAALDYALDLTVARQLRDARDKARMAWRYTPGWPVLKQLMKIQLLAWMGRGAGAR